MSVQLNFSPLPGRPERGPVGRAAGPALNPALPRFQHAAAHLGFGARARLLIDDWYRLRTLLLRQVRHAHQP